MGVEARIRYLLRAATRAEREGDDWVAQVFRRMAEEAGAPTADVLARTLGSGAPCPQD